MMTRWLFSNSYFDRNQEIAIYRVMILCCTKHESLSCGISLSVEVLFISHGQRRGAGPQLSMSLISMAALCCCFVAGTVCSSLKLQLISKLHLAEKLCVFRYKMKSGEKTNKTPGGPSSTSSAWLSDWLVWLGYWIKMPLVLCLYVMPHSQSCCALLGITGCFAFQVLLLEYMSCVKLKVFSGDLRCNCNR